MTRAHLIPSPLGDIAIRIEDDALTGLFFVGQKYYPPLAIAPDANADADAEVHDASPLVRKVADEVAEYFTGARERFTVPIHLRGTAFQRSVWVQLLAIPFGELVSYGDITARVGLPMSAARAVGGAVGRNPVSIMVPCHRVIGASGSLTGYAGGIERKRALLSLEGAGFVRGERQPVQQTLAF
ncbi:methylated-DNA--[protein]-cysteine S-methyltransferase [Burkholderia latens]|uniref:methylated-DNA--[protein]-cysteine S-methyltransferase n=1 Tax=Burkholderia latens TaxID=488446 RepID=UPI001589A505|nr:methylated-DNA--[protein]-cysteine S-methyltransferase [Burkholderia latens]